MMQSVKEQIARELHRPARRNYLRRRTIIKDFWDLYQADLAEMQTYARENKGYRYILVVINCYSKYLWTEPVKNKTGEVITKAMQTVLKQSGQPRNLQTDQGKEFFNSAFAKLMSSYGINHYNTYSVKKASIAERAIRTLKSKLYLQFSIRGTYRWHDIIRKVTNEYNNTKHRTIGMTPADVTPETDLKAYSQLKIAPTNTKFKRGDTVRISTQKGIFNKGYTGNWSTELFKVVKVNITNPVTYMLEDEHKQPIKGCFYNQELQRTKSPDVYLVEKVLKRKGSKVFVRWLGFSSAHNSWVDKNNIL